MKVIIAGSRHLERIADVIDAIHASKFEITEVVSGACPTGVDAIGEWLAGVFFDTPIPVTRFKAEWGKFGLAAGPRRNRQMAQYADALIIVWDGVSNGSASMVREAKFAGIKVYEYIIK